MQNATGNAPVYAVRDVDGKGQGLVATQAIPKGTRILCEEPILSVSRLGRSEDIVASLSKQVDDLAEDRRRVFLSLANIHPHTNDAERYFGIFRTVSLPAGKDAADAGIFADACRINHACDNNAQKSWNGNIGRHTVHALRDIAEGEEITVFYMATEQDRETRQAHLREKWDFTCACGLCSLPPDKSRESDRRLDEIDRLGRLIGRGGLAEILSSPLRTLRHVDRQVALYVEKDPDDPGLTRAYFDAAQISIANGDLARGRVFAERAVARWRIALGDDSEEVQQHGAVAADPSTHRLHGLSGKWRTAVDDVPRDLAPAAFEVWLWRRSEPGVPHAPADLRRRAVFPAFADLPGEHDAHPEFYRRTDAGGHRPSRHWCFLAEIVETSFIVRLQLSLEDLDGKSVPLIFYTPGAGRELDPGLAREGHTVAVLYAVRRRFLFSEPGIRLEDLGRFKIFPVSLDNLLELSDLVRQYSTEFDGARKCHGCDKKGTSLKHCARCRFFWYCSKECQVAAWDTMGHKAICKLLKDPDLQRFLALAWDDFGGHVGFPLLA